MGEHPDNLKIIFVYNADSGLFNTVTDIAHKIFSPSTYACQLCALTHSHFSVKEEWQSFLKELSQPLEFLHKDEFLQAYPDKKFDYPVILQMNEAVLDVLIDANALSQCKSLDELKKLIKESLNTQ